MVFLINTFVIKVNEIVNKFRCHINFFITRDSDISLLTSDTTASYLISTVFKCHSVSAQRLSVSYVYFCFIVINETTKVFCTYY